MSLLEWCQWLQHSTLGTGIRESGYAYPLIEGTHVLGLALSVGYTASTLPIARRRQQRGTVASTSSDQAPMPPRRLERLRNPSREKYSAAC